MIEEQNRGLFTAARAGEILSIGLAWVEDTIRQAIEIGERDGVITFDQLNELCGLDLEAEDIERVGVLSGAGIRVE